MTDEEKMEMMFKGKKPETVKAEEKPVEDVQKPVEEEKKETNTETPPAEEKPVKELDFSLFGEKFGREIDNEDSLKSLFEKADKYEQTDKEYQDTLQKLSELKTIADKADPMANFLNEDEFKRQQLLIKHSETLSKDAIKELSVLNPSSVEDMSDVDALRLGLMVDKGLTKKEADAYLLRKYELEDFGADDIEEGVKTAMKVDAIDSRRDVTKLYDGITVPEKVDYESARTQVKEAWDTAMPDLVKGIDKIQIEEGLDFIVTEEMKAGLVDKYTSLAMQNQLKPSEEAAAEMMGAMRGEILLNNIDKFVKSVRADIAENVKEETRKTLHNDKPVDNSSRSQNSSNDDNDTKMNRMLG